MSKKEKRKLIMIIIALFFFVILIIVDNLILSSIKSARNEFIVRLSLYLTLYLFIAHDIVIKAIKNIFHGQMLDENFLMCIASIGALCIGDYKEGLAVVLFYQVGEWFQVYAVGKSRKSISSLMDIRPDYANVLKDGKWEMVDPYEVNINDIILVKPGEKIPLDGIITKGISTLDTKALTGEAIPLDVYEGIEVISGTINLTSTLEIIVQKEFHNSTVSKILDLVENASSKKAKTENFITKFSMFYTPIVVLCAVLLAIIPGFITKDYNEWLYRALSFLVVSCPCALVISIPLSFFAGIGAASKRGILIKGSNYLEQLNKTNIFVFDKTGTLTKGNFEVVDIFPQNNKEEILRLAAIAEYGSNHPIAASIKKAYGQEITNEYVLEEILGKGIMAKGHNEILCGNAKLMKEYNINYEECKAVGTIVYVALDGKYMGSIVISDEIKEKAKETISYLKSINAKTIMLTGDNEKTSADVAQKLGIDDYYFSLLPHEKVQMVDNMLENKKENDVLCFLGDGINDAPVIMQSDIGIAMGGVGSDAAIEASDIVFMHDDLEAIIVSRKIASRTMKIIKQNIIFALAIKFLILLLSALGITNMWFAVFGDVGVSVIAIINAMRVNSKIYAKE